MTNHQLQILSPAKDKQVAFAAIQAGADAIYIGAPAYGARQAAGNSLEDLTEVVRYAHTYGVQVLVTLNTLLRDDEYADAVALAHALYSIGVDALIIQDLHLLDLDLPPIRLHASTQCDNRTPEQVKRLRDMGFKRVVLARELSIDEIRAIHQAVPDIELEAFVHGALCVSYSGRCYISEVLAGRSANRGACAQFCRMAYDLLDAEGNEVLDDDGQPIHQRYLLSLQDLDRSAYLQELIDAGVTTFKIEGRLKDADYVTNITAFYREKLDNLTPTLSTGRGSSSLEGRLGGVFTRSFVPDPSKTFHRGATDYFLHGRTRPMANWATPKSTGEYIGEVLEARGNTLRVRLNDGIVLHNGDGLTIGAEGCNVNGIEGNLVKINKSLTSHSKAVSRLTSILNDYDQETKDFRDWKVTYTAEELSEIVRTKSGIDFGEIMDLIPLHRGASGRIDQLKIVGTKRTEVIGKELKIRLWLSKSCLYSSWFEVQKLPMTNDKSQMSNQFTLIGHGWGHGAGLCQIGAAVMASEGHQYEEILSYYYVGSRLSPTAL